MHILRSIFSSLVGTVGVAAACLLALSGAAPAQTPGTGAISGTVYDPADRVVANADVLIDDDATHISRTVKTNTDGLFFTPLLLPGKYTVSVTAPRFAPSISHSIEVTVSETTTLNVVLAVAQAKSSIRVEASPEIVQLESSTLGGLVNESAIRALPLSSRNYTQILGLSPGVIADLPTPTVLGDGTQNVTSNGATPTSNNIQFNGIDANNLQENSAATAQNYEVGTGIPAPDTIEEFRVQTANYDATYGRGSGANVDLVSKSGTNSFHGSAWEFVRNNIFNANDFFSKLADQPRSDLKQNEFGGAVGGPIRKNRAFFFGAYQGLTQVNGLGSLKTATLPVLTSDRSAATLGAQFCPAAHLNDQNQPATGYLTTAGGAQVACDGSNINPVALAILNARLPNGQFAIPSPQVVLPPSSGTDPSDQLPQGLSTFSPPSHYREDQFTVNEDQVLTAKNTLAGRFFYSRATIDLPFAPNGTNLPGWGTNALNRNTMFVLSDTHVFNSNIVNIARLGYMRFDGLVLQENPLTAQSVGIGTPTGAVDSSSHMPAMTVAGFTFGDGGTPSDWSVTNSFIWQDALSLTKGRQNFRFGIEFKRHQVDEDQPQQVDGNVMIASFNDFLLGESAAQNGSPLGLSNIGAGIAGGGIFRRDERYNNFAGLTQDNIRLTPKLTVNAGVRYEIFGAPTDINGRLTNFDPSLAVPGLLDPAGTFTGFTVASNFQGIPPAGVMKNSYAGYYKTPYGDVSPRLGFSWQLTGKPIVVLRGGFGVYFDQHSGNIAEATLGQPPYALSQFNAGTPNGPATLQSPFVPLIPLSSTFPIFVPRVPFGVPFIEGINPNFKDGKTYEYNLNVQYSFGRDYLLQIGYVGTNSVHRPGQIEFDQSLLASPEDPVNGETTNSVTNVINRMPIQGLSPGSLLTDSVFIANYNSLVGSITKRLSRGLQLQGSYTWSKNLDEVNGEGGLDVFELQLPTNNQLDIRNSYGPANDDRAQRFVANFVWDVPRFGAGPTAARYALNGWQFSGIALIQSGAALSVFDSNAGSVYGLLNSQTRAELAPGGHITTHGSLFSRVVGNGRYLDANAFMRAPEVVNGTSIADEDFGNSGVGIVRGPGQHNLDFAISRSFPVAENKNFVFRAESFNLTNTPQFGNPNTSLGYGDPLGPAVASPGFGQITSEQGGPHPRIVQFALKFEF
jgi:Carboxypeptidase regulatory-like domain/TonB dependent receptor